MNFSFYKINSNYEAGITDKINYECKFHTTIKININQSNLIKIK